MSSWHPNDLVSDVDLAAYERDILDRFGVDAWTDKRQKALDDWLVPNVESAGFSWARFRTRYEPDAAYSYISSAYADVTAACQDTTSDDLLVGTIFASTSNALYLASTEPFRGLSVRMLDTVSSATATLSVAYWADTWTTLDYLPGSTQNLRLAFKGGGALLWALPADWTQRSVNSSSRYYWAKLTVSAAITAGAKAGQVGCIRRSRLCAAATFKTLERIYAEAQTGQEGPWRDKADYYQAEADAALARALPLIGGEFEATGSESDAIDADEAAQTAAEASGGGWTLERY